MSVSQVKKGYVSSVDLLAGGKVSSSTFSGPSPANIADKSCVIDLPYNGGPVVHNGSPVQFPSKKVGGEPDRQNVWTRWKGTFGESVQSVRASGLNTCVGLVIAAKKTGGLGFDNVVVFHFGGTGSKTNRLDPKESWAKVLGSAPDSILKATAGWKGSSFAVAMAGPQHPGSSDEFEEEYQSIVQQCNIRSPVLFWGGQEPMKETKGKKERIIKGKWENPIDGTSSPKSKSAVELQASGKVYAWHYPLSG